MTTLRYFNARGRGQFMRAFLTAHGVEFTDERIFLDDFNNWYAVRDDRSLTGPLQKLPVLEHGGELIPETFVIAGFLQQTFGDSDALGETGRLRHDVLVSTAYIDLMLPIGTAIWADRLYGVEDLSTLARMTLERFKRSLAAIDQSLAEWRWVDAMHERKVTVADCLLWEELDQAVTLFGPHLPLEDFPELHRLRVEHPARASFERLLAENPCQLTGRPGEADAIRRLRALFPTAAEANLQ